LVTDGFDRLEEGSKVVIRPQNAEPSPQPHQTPAPAKPSPLKPAPPGTANQPSNTAQPNTAQPNTAQPNTAQPKGQAAPQK